MKKTVLLGGGGHAQVVAELVRLLGDYEIVGVIDPALPVGSKVLGVTVLGDDTMLTSICATGIGYACNGIGSVRNNDKRESLFVEAKRCGLKFPVLCHPTAIISNSSKLKEGAQVMAGAIIQAGTEISENCIINTGAIVEHGCKVNASTHVGPGALVSGDCTICRGAFIGAGAVIIQGVKIGENSVIGAGAVVIRDVCSGESVKGVPAR